MCCIIALGHAMERNQSSDASLKLTGHVTSGMKKGGEFISKSGYTKQFLDRLGYEPFPGTLNIELNGESERNRDSLDEMDNVLIGKWSDGTKSFGAVLCYPATISARAAGENTEQCHVIVPKRTDHRRDVVEVIAPGELREELDVTDGDEVKLYVSEP
jgi:riboflavin kinase